jgi:hypothetical protein
VFLTKQQPRTTRIYADLAAELGRANVTGKLLSSSKLCPTSAIHPHSSPIVAPGFTKHAGRIAVDVKQHDTAPGVGAAVMPPHVIGRAAHLHAEALLLTVTVVVFITIEFFTPIVLTPSSADFEIGTAAAVHPNSVTVVSPTLSAQAVGVAALHDQAHAAAGVSPAVLPTHIV